MFSSLSRKRVIVLVVLTCLLLVTLDKHGNPVIDKMRSGLSRVLSPLDHATRAITLPLERVWYGITNYDDVERENEALRDQIAHQKGDDVEARTAVLEYRELLKVLNLTSKFTIPNVMAQIVGDSPSNFQSTIEINVGSSKGIEVGMPVTDGAGLIGKVTKVYPDRSIVLLMTDPLYGVKVQVLSPEEAADVAGDPSTSDPITSGSDVLTSDSTTTSSTTTTTTIATADTTITADPTDTSGGIVTGETTGDPTAGGTTTTVVDVVRETGTLRGQGGDKPLLLTLVDATSSLTKVKVGAVVTTAGGTGVFASPAPLGIPIGVITRVVTQSDNSSAIVEVTPNANLRKLFFVAVVLYSSKSASGG